jgi:pimeloyl-ACP methyl ester carboxylesterase
MTQATLDARANFYPDTTGMRLLRLSFATTQKLWPALAVRAAYRLFGTPLPPKWAARRHAWRAEWQPDSLPFEDASITLHTRPDFANAHAPMVVLVHGWGGHAGQMLALANAVAAQGWQPVLAEMPAHGQSEGRVSNLPQFARAIDYLHARLREQGHTVHAVVAHSMGANASAFAVSRGLPVERLVLIAPPASALEFTRLFGRVFGLSEATRAAMQRRVETREGVLMSQLEPPAVGPRIHVPTLVVHDRGDRVNAFADGQAYQATIRGARLVDTQGLGHRKLLKDTDVLRAVVDFLR